VNGIISHRRQYKIENLSSLPTFFQVKYQKEMSNFSAALLLQAKKAKFVQYFVVENLLNKIRILHITFQVLLHHFSKIKSQKEVTKGNKSKFF